MPSKSISYNIDKKFYKRYLQKNKKKNFLSYIVKKNFFIVAKKYLKIFPVGKDFQNILKTHKIY